MGGCCPRRASPENEVVAEINELLLFIREFEHELRLVRDRTVYQEQHRDTPVVSRARHQDLHKGHSE